MMNEKYFRKQEKSITCILHKVCLSALLIIEISKQTSFQLSELITYGRKCSDYALEGAILICARTSKQQNCSKDIKQYFLDIRSVTAHLKDVCTFSFPIYVKELYQWRHARRSSEMESAIQRITTALLTLTLFCKKCFIRCFISPLIIFTSSSESSYICYFECILNIFLCLDRIRRVLLQFFLIFLSYVV